MLNDSSFFEDLSKSVNDTWKERFQQNVTMYFKQSLIDNIAKAAIRMLKWVSNVYNSTGSPLYHVRCDFAWTWEPSCTVCVFEGTLLSFIWAGSALRSNLLSFRIPFWQTRYPFCISFAKQVLFSHSFCNFLDFRNEVNKTDNQTDFLNLSFTSSCEIFTFFIPETWKR